MQILHNLCFYLLMPEMVTLANFHAVIATNGSKSCHSRLYLIPDLCRVVHACSRQENHSGTFLCAAAVEKKAMVSDADSSSIACSEGKVRDTKDEQDKRREPLHN